jgi:predicted nucleic acid-binding protein
MRDVLFSCESVILDACVIINLYASGHMQSILESIPKPVSIAAYVHEMEAQKIYTGPDEDVTKETELINLQSFVDRKLLHVVHLDDGPEAVAAVDFSAATRLDTGEAISAAIALHRCWSLATDDKTAISFFTRQVPQLHLISTPELLKHWIDATHPHIAVVNSVVGNIRKRARYEPHHDHSLYRWWKACGEDPF